MRKPSMPETVPAPQRVTHACGGLAVEIFYFSERASAVLSTVICSVCNPTFYAKAERRRKEEAA